MVGTAVEIADMMQSWLETDACDGFNIPELQRRGLFRILERPLRPTMRAYPPLPAIFLRLRLNKVLLQSRQCPFSLLPPVLISCVRTVPSLAVRLHPDAPLHPIPPTGRFRPRPYQPQV
jgi:hypothetical protein